MAGAPPRPGPRRFQGWSCAPCAAAWRLQPDCSGRCRWRHRRGLDHRAKKSFHPGPRAPATTGAAGLHRVCWMQRFDQVVEARRVGKILAPRSQVNAGQDNFLAAQPLQRPFPGHIRAASTSANGRLRPAPRARRVTQNVQWLSQPSCTLMNARVRRCAPGNGSRAMGSRSNISAGRCSRSGNQPVFICVGHHAG